MTETISESPVLMDTSNLKLEPIDRPHSPESNCPICLEEFTNKSYSNSCLHQFCYICLKEWSKIKPECPLCKQRFHTIIHNVRSLDDYDQYHVNTSSNSIEFDQTVFINFAFPASPVPYSFRNALDFRRNPLEFRQRMVEADVYRSPMSSPSSMLYIREVNSLVRATDTIHPASLPLEHDFRSPNLALSRYRRDIYRRGRWVRPAQSSRIRQSSPEFYRLNPAQTHRLVPWLTRELYVLLDVSIDPQTLVQEILNLITLYPIQSRHFREAMRPHLGDRTEQFVHEFYHFAVSPHDIVSYDIMAEYGPQDTRPHRLAREESSESDSDVEVVNILRGAVEMNVLDLTSHGPSTSSTNFPDTIIEISDSSNSDDEVEIVGMIAPVTPETILIESTDEEMNTPEVGPSNFIVKNETSVIKTNDSAVKHDFDPHQPCSSNSVIKFKRVSPSLKENTSSSSLSSSSTSSTSTSSSSSSSASPSVYSSSSLSSVSDSDFGRKKTSHKRKRRKTFKRERANKRHRRRLEIESSSSDDEYSSENLLKRQMLRSVDIKAESKAVLNGSYSDSE